MNRRLSIGLLLIAVVALSSGVWADSRIDWQVISNGGTEARSINYAVMGTVGQTAVGWSASTSYRNHAGFWQSEAGGGCCVGDRGNVDGSADQTPGLGDLTVMIDYLFVSFEGLPCWEEANVDASQPEGDGSITLGDLTRLIDHLFVSFNPLPPCP